MTPDEIRGLLRQSEGPTLDFKQQWYLRYQKGEARERQKDELIKDLLSLANGTAQTAGQSAYLIIGAGDRQKDDGSRELFDIDDSFTTARDILQLVNEACKPPIPDVMVEIILIDSVRIGVITIPPTIFLHETIKVLKPTDGTSYPVHIVFTRHNDSVRNASTDERTAILEAKKHAYAARYIPREIVKPMSPMQAIGIGALAGGFFSAMAAKAAYDVQGQGNALSAVLGMGIAGILIGALFGWIFLQIVAFIRIWIQSLWLERMLLLFCVVLIIGVLQLIKSLL